MTLTETQRRLMALLVEWALDQDHDATGFGDDDWLYFLRDEDAAGELGTNAKVRHELNAALGLLIKT